MDSPDDRRGRALDWLDNARRPGPAQGRLVCAAIAGVEALLAVDGRLREANDLTREGWAVVHEVLESAREAS